MNCFYTRLLNILPRRDFLRHMSYQAFGRKCELLLEIVPLKYWNVAVTGIAKRCLILSKNQHVATW